MTRRHHLPWLAHRILLTAFQGVLQFAILLMRRVVVLIVGIPSVLIILGGDLLFPEDDGLGFWIVLGLAGLVWLGMLKLSWIAHRRLQRWWWQLQAAEPRRRSPIRTPFWSAPLSLDRIRRRF